MTRTREQIEMELLIYSQILENKRTEIEKERIEELWTKLQQLDRRTS